jgi:hypothetical protein
MSQIPRGLMTARARHGSGPGGHSLLPWLLPVFVALAVWNLSASRLTDALVVMVGIPVLIFLVKRPGASLITLVIFLPLELIGFSLLLRWHVPAKVLRQAGSIKELLVLAVVIAGIQQIRRTGRHLDRIDAAVLIYVAVVSIYLVVPHLFSSLAPSDWSTRILAWRSDAVYPLLFFGARHAPIAPHVKERYLKFILVMGAIAGLLAVYQRIDATAWQTFILHTANVPAYELNVLRLNDAQIGTNLAYIFNLSPLRTSSIFLSPFDMADFLLLVIAVAGVRISTNRRGFLSYFALAAALAGIFFSRSRSDGLAALVILLLIALPTSRNPVQGRMKLVGALVLAAVLVVPALGGSRFVGAQGGSKSAAGHVTEIQSGFRVLINFPLGVGLGDNPATATRFTSITARQANPNFITDNLALQVGDELGFQALLPWLLALGLILWELRRRGGLGDPFAATLGFGLLGIVIAGIYHQVFLTFPVPWTLWAGLGLACSANRTPYEDALATNVSVPVAGVP